MNSRPRTTPSRPSWLRVVAGLLVALGLIVSGVGVTRPPIDESVHPLGLDCRREHGVRFCRGGPGLLDDRRVGSWDGFPLDADVTLPAHGEGPWPLLIMQHPWGFSKTIYEATSPDGGTKGFLSPEFNNIWFAEHGYAVLTYTARGMVDSCGPLIGSFLSGTGMGPFGCPDDHFLHFADIRYESRDAQHLAGLLVDQGIAEPGVGVTGWSYGAGQTLLLTQLKNRVAVGLDGDGSPILEPWTSPAGVPMEIKAGVAVGAWSDFMDTAMSNGRSLDYRLDTATTTTDPYGVVRQSWIEFLYLSGVVVGEYADIKEDPGAALPDWLDLFNEGEPYDPGDIDQIIQAVQPTRSPAFIPAPDSPVPVMAINGWTDDLFPPSQIIRLHNQIKATDADAIFLLRFASVGHARAQNKLADLQHFTGQVQQFFSRHLLGDPAADPGPDVQSLTVTCPDNAPSGGPLNADSYETLALGRVDWSTADTQTVDAHGGREELGWAIDPVPIIEDLGVPWEGPPILSALPPLLLSEAGVVAPSPLEEGDACRTTTTGQSTGVATYQLPGGEFTILGLPTIRATIRTQHGAVEGELAFRLWDVDEAASTQTLITKGIYRLESDQTGEIVTQLNGAGWSIGSGHHPKLEVLGRDHNTWRPSNNTAFTVDVEELEIVLPTAEADPATDG
jgi:hypothetical protein